MDKAFQFNIVYTVHCTDCSYRCLEVWNLNPVKDIRNHESSLTYLYIQLTDFTNTNLSGCTASQISNHIKRPTIQGILQKSRLKASSIINIYKLLVVIVMNVNAPADSSLILILFEFTALNLTLKSSQANIHEFENLHMSK